MLSRAPACSLVVSLASSSWMVGLGESVPYFAPHATRTIRIALIVTRPNTGVPNIDAARYHTLLGHSAPSPCSAFAVPLPLLDRRYTCVIPCDQGWLRCSHGHPDCGRAVLGAFTVDSLVFMWCPQRA